MKTIIQIIIVITLFTNSTSAQTQDSSRTSSTKIGKAQIAVGKIIKKEYSDFVKFVDKGKTFIRAEGDCYEITFELLKITDAVTQLENIGLRVESKGNYSYQSYYGYIDEDEIPSLIKFLELVLKIANTNSETQVEYIYNSNDLRIFCANKKEKKENKWICGIDLDKYSSRGNYLFKDDEINILLSKLKEVFGGK